MYNVTTINKNKRELDGKHYIEKKRVKTINNIINKNINKTKNKS